MRMVLMFMVYSVSLLAILRRLEPGGCGEGPTVAYRRPVSELVKPSERGGGGGGGVWATVLREAHAPPISSRVRILPNGFDPKNLGSGFSIMFFSGTRWLWPFPAHPTHTANLVCVFIVQGDERKSRAAFYSRT
jgi:hypothetical protein